MPQTVFMAPNTSTDSESGVQLAVRWAGTFGKLTVPATAASQAANTTSESVAATGFTTSTSSNGTASFYDYSELPGSQLVAVYMVVYVTVDDYARVGGSSAMPLESADSFTVLAVFASTESSGNITMWSTPATVVVGIVCVDIAGHMSVSWSAVVVPYAPPPAPTSPSSTPSVATPVVGALPFVASWSASLCVCSGVCQYNARVLTTSSASSTQQVTTTIAMGTSTQLSTSKLLVSSMDQLVRYQPLKPVPIADLSDPSYRVLIAPVCLCKCFAVCTGAAQMCTHWLLMTCTRVANVLLPHRRSKCSATMRGIDRRAGCRRRRRLWWC